MITKQNKTYAYILYTHTYTHIYNIFYRFHGECVNIHEGYEGDYTCRGCIEAVNNAVLQRDNFELDVESADYEHSQKLLINYMYTASSGLDASEGFGNNGEKKYAENVYICVCMYVCVQYNILPTELVCLHNAFPFANYTFRAMRFVFFCIRP